MAACALNADLRAWEHGDATLVGERGVALSGEMEATFSGFNGELPDMTSASKGGGGHGKAEIVREVA